ncbi:hypothetical protein Tco_0290510 [Tanacetum coccineum]
MVSLWRYPSDSELLCSQTYLRLTISPNEWSSNSLGLFLHAFVILDLELLSLSFDFVIDSKIFKSFSLLVMNIQRISLTGFLAQSVGSSNTEVLDTPCLLDLFIGTSQSRQHGGNGCAWYGSAARGCMISLWLTGSRSIMELVIARSAFAVSTASDMVGKFWKKLVGSIVPLVKPLDMRKFESSSYQALEACFNPYRAFLSRTRPEGLSTDISCLGGTWPEVLLLANITKATKDVKVFDRRFPVIDDVIRRLSMSRDNDGSPQLEYGFVFRQRRSVKVFEE